MLRSFRRDHSIKSKALGQVMSFCYKSILADRTIFRNSYDKGRVISIYQLEHKTNERMSQSINQSRIHPYYAQGKCFHKWEPSFTPSETDYFFFVEIVILLYIFYLGIYFIINLFFKYNKIEKYVMT